jgi:hypothetical protein
MKFSASYNNNSNHWDFQQFYMHILNSEGEFDKDSFLPNF